MLIIVCTVDHKNLREPIKYEISGKNVRCTNFLTKLRKMMKMARLRKPLTCPPKKKGNEIPSWQRVLKIFFSRKVIEGRKSFGLILYNSKTFWTLMAHSVLQLRSYLNFVISNLKKFSFRYNSATFEKFLVRLSFWFVKTLVVLFESLKKLA